MKEKQLDMKFVAGQSFIQNFNKKYSITSTKIIKFVSNKHILEKEKLEHDTSEFRAKITNNIENNNKDLILNSDPTAFNYEATSE
jgi:hypothetical protein